MNDHIIDCCSLLNLMTGWRGLSQIGEFDWTWHICAAVFYETEHTREIGPDGKFVLVPVRLDSVKANGLVRATEPENDAEMASYIDFALELDDGEAQALAIAKHRGFTLLTDDRKALAIARRENVATISTVDVLQHWAKLAAENEQRLHEIIMRITTLARFRPRAGSPHYDWWMHYLGNELA